MVGNNELSKAIADAFAKVVETIRQEDWVPKIIPDLNQTAKSLENISISSKAASAGMKLLSSVASSAASMGATWLLFEALPQWLDYCTISFEEQTQTVKELNQSYIDTQNELSTIGLKIAENKNKIIEMNQHPLSILDKETLALLQEENEELERQATIQQQLAANAKKEKGKETSKLLTMKSQESETRKTSYYDSAIDAYEKGEFGKGLLQSTKYWIGGDMLTKQSAAKDSVNPLENTADQIKQVSALNAQLKSLDRTSKDYEKNKKNLNDKLAKNNMGLSQNIAWLGKQKKQLDASDPAQKKQIDTITSLEKQYVSATNALQSVNSETKEELIARLKSIGILNAEEVAERSLINAKIENAIRSEIASGNTNALSASTENLILKQYGLTAGTKEASDMMALWSLKKYIASNDALGNSLSNDSTAFLNLATAAGIAASSVSRYAEVIALLEKLETLKNSAYTDTGAASYAGITIGEKKKALKAELAQLESEIKANMENALKVPSKLSFNSNKPPSYSQEFAPKSDLKNSNAIPKDIYKEGTESFNQRMELSKNWIEDRNTYGDWGADNEIAAWRRVRAWTEDYYKKDLISQKTYLEEKRTLSKNITNAIQKDYEKQLADRKKLLETQKDSLQSIIDLTVELIKKEKEDQKTALEEQKTLYGKIISAKKESLRLTERELSYQEEVDSKVKDISKLQAQADALGLDDSREAQAKRAELLEQIAEKQKELNQYQHEDSVEKAEEALDKQEELFNEEKDKEILSIENYLKNSGLLVQEAMNRIDTEGDLLYEKLLEYNAVYGSGISTELTTAWESAKIALEEYGATLSAIQQIQNNLNGVEKEQEDNNSSSLTPESRQNLINQMIGNAKAWQNADAKERKVLEEKNKNLGALLGAEYDAQTGKWYTDKTKKVPLFHNGLASGFTGNEFTPRQNEIYALLSKDELVLNKFDQLQLGEKLRTASLAEKLSNTSYLPFNSVVNNTSGDVSITVTSPITIQGNADKATTTELHKFGEKLSKTMLSDLNAAFSKKGITVNPTVNTTKAQ